MLSRYKRVYKPDEWDEGVSETVPVKGTASDDIAKQPKGIHESAVTPQGLHYDAMHNATTRRPVPSYIAMPDMDMISKRISLPSPFLTPFSLF